MKFNTKEKKLIIDSLNLRLKLDRENWESDVNEILFEFEHKEVYLSRLQMSIIIGCLTDNITVDNQNDVYKIINFFEEI